MSDTSLTPQAARAAKRAARRSSPYPTPKVTIFRYGPLHDLEALWWVSAYFLFARSVVEDITDDVELSSSRAKLLVAQRSAARRLFCDRNTRWKIIELSGHFLDEVPYLHPLVRSFGDELEATRQELLNHYVHVEEDIDAREFEVPTNIYNTYRKTWHTMARYMKEDHIHVKYLDIHTP